jgi:hypothetical protein
MPSDINKPIFFIIPSILPAKVILFPLTTKQITLEKKTNQVFSQKQIPRHDGWRGINI